MRTPDQDGSGEDVVSGSVGDGFGASAGDLEDGFGDDDFSDDPFDDGSFGDDTADTGGTADTVDTDEGSFGDDTGDGPFGDDGGDSGDTPFGDGLSDAEAENVLVEILEDVFGSDTDALDEADAGGTGSGSGADVFEALDGAPEDEDGGFVDTLNDVLADNGSAPVVDDFDPFEPTDIPSGDDFDLTRDGRVDVHDLHEAAHPFDFGISE